jgi:hypothetical protein
MTELRVDDPAGVLRHIVQRPEDANRDPGILSKEEPR